jgi:uncharacterized membrane protein
MDVVQHLKHHRWFYLSLLLAVVAWFLASVFARTLRLFAAFDVFYLSYLILQIVLVFNATPDELRKRAAVDDEGMFFIPVITAVAVSFSLISIFELLNQADKPNGLRLILSIGSAPLAWGVVHTIAAFHYGHRFYADLSPGPDVTDARGLKFPETEEPALSDFLYYSFVVGMTCQVSDVQVTSQSMRKLTLVHGIVSFFLNTVLIALAVNVAVAMGQSWH